MRHVPGPFGFFSTQWLRQVNCVSACLVIHTPSARRFSHRRMSVSHV
jgi:hypothetical protein